MKAGRISPKALRLACLALGDSVEGLTPQCLAEAIRGYEPGGNSAPGPKVGQLLMLREVADRLRLSEKSVIRLIGGGKIKALRVGTGAKRKKVRVSEKALLEFEEGGA